MILVCGEALFDMFGTETEAGFTFEAHAAGSPFNVAVGLRRLGVASALCTGVSSDFLGDKLVGRLREEDVDQSHIQRLDAPSTSAFVTLSESGSATYAFYGEGAADRSLPATHPIDATGCDAIHFGSYSFVVGSTAVAYDALMKREAGTKFLSYDPNVRPTVEPDMGVWRRRLQAAAACCDLIKMSDEDAGHLFPGMALDDIAANLLTKASRIVLITRGGDGASAYTNAATVHVTAPRVDVIDTVGAGDSFQAATLAHLSLTGQLNGALHLDLPAMERLLTFAQRAAALTASRRGADLPSAKDLA